MKVKRSDYCLNNLLYNIFFSDLLKNQTFSQEAARQAGLAEGENFTLANFSYSNSVILQRMFHHISSTDFLGITVTQIMIMYYNYYYNGLILQGRVEFDKNGIRDLDQVTIMQFIPMTGDDMRIVSLSLILQLV